MIQNIDDLSYEKSSRHPEYYIFTYKGEIASNWNLADWIDMDCYQFHELMQKQYNAELLSSNGSSNVYFKDKKTIIEVLDWMKSIILARTLAGDTDSHFVKMLKGSVLRFL